MFEGKDFFFSNPMDLFLNKLKSGCFTKCKEKEIQLEKKLYDHFILSHFKDIFNDLKI